MYSPGGPRFQQTSRHLAVDLQIACISLRRLLKLIRQEGPGSVRFGYGVWGWNGSSGSGFRFCSSAKRVFCVSVQFNRKGRFRFRFRFLEKRFRRVPVPLSVSGKTVPTVPVTGSGSVREPPGQI